MDGVPRRRRARLILADAFSDSWSQAAGADAALEMLRDAVTAANELLADLDRYCATGAYVAASKREGQLISAAGSVPPRPRCGKPRAAAQDAPAPPPPGCPAWSTQDCFLYGPGGTHENQLAVGDQRR
jgi:hypothetical protein